jgi:hypothetical protein
MNVAELKPGTNLQLEDGSTVQVVTPSTDGESVRVRYLESPFSPELVGTEADCTDYEITGYTTDGSHTDTGTRPG